MVAVTYTGNSIAIIDVPARTVLRLPVTVDSGIMHPQQKIIALRSAGNLQIYNLELKTKIKTTVMSETVVYWKWYVRTLGQGLQSVIRRGGSTHC